MVTYFNKKDLTSFGNYLLSDERRQRILDSYNFDIDESLKNEEPYRGLSFEERFGVVTHADYMNWLEWRKK